MFQQLSNWPFIRSWSYRQSVFFLNIFKHWPCFEYLRKNLQPFRADFIHTTAEMSRRRVFCLSLSTQKGFKKNQWVSGLGCWREAPPCLLPNHLTDLTGGKKTDYEKESTTTRQDGFQIWKEKGRVFIIHLAFPKFALSWVGRKSRLVFRIKPSVGVHRPLKTTMTHLWQIYRPYLASWVFFPTLKGIYFVFLFMVSSLSLLCADAAGCPGVWGPGGGSGVPGPRGSSAAGQMVPTGGGDPGLARLPHPPEEWVSLSFATLQFATDVR